MAHWTIRTVYWIILNIVAMWVTVMVVPGISIIHSQDIVYVGIVLALVNGWIGPILRLVTSPLRLITFGLFSLIVNWLLFVSATWISRKFGASVTISGMLPALEGALIVAVILYLGNRMPFFTAKKRGD